MVTMRRDEALPTLGRHSPRLAEVRRICLGEREGLTVVDGTKLISDLAAAGVSFELLLVTPQTYPALARRLAGHADKVFLVEADALERVAPTQHSQGALGVVKVPRRDLQASGVVVYLDRIQDPGNVGAVIRCAAAFDVAGVACSDQSADPFSPRAIRASAGHALLLPVARHVPFLPLAEQFQLAGGDVVATLGSGGTPLPAWQGRPPLLLALGNEGQGLTPEILAASSSQVSIPLRGGVESLNVAVTAGIMLASLAGLAGAPILRLKTKRRAR